MQLVAALILLGLAAIGTATDVKTCGATSRDFTESGVEITGCSKPPCRLKKGTKVAVTIPLSPEKNIDKLDTRVFAEVVGVPLPFIGVDGTDACAFIFAEDGTTKAGCPLKAGTKYIYKNAFDVLSIYPRIKVDVQWALEYPVDTFSYKNLHCFRVQSKIVN